MKGTMVMGANIVFGLMSELRAENGKGRWRWTWKRKRKRKRKKRTRMDKTWRDIPLTV